LETLGLEASIGQFCNDLAEARQLTVDLEIVAPPAALELDAALGLYRITQEALHNVMKHSGAARATVTLKSDGDGIVLRIIDDGVGFDLERVRQKDTLGQISMRERARMIRAQLLVSSRPGAGTTVEVHLPFDPSQTQSAV
jgi:signal transduction histidine kinase